MTEWTDAMRERVRVLHAVPLSYEAIARAITAEFSVPVTKNAVVGHAHRMNLPSRPSPIIRRGPSKKKKPVLAPIALPQAAPLPEVAEDVARSQVAHIRAQIAAVTARAAGVPSSRRCHFPMWPDTARPRPSGPLDTPTFGPALFCGEPVERGGYCEHHAAVCFRERLERVA